MLGPIEVPAFDIALGSGCILSADGTWCLGVSPLEMLAVTDA